MVKKNLSVEYIVVLLIVVIVLGIPMYRLFDKASNERKVTVKITDKVVKNGKDSSKYLIFCEDESGNIVTYEVTDSLLMFRFDSSDVYGSLKTDKTYELTVRGSRNTVLSWYPNVYECKEVD